MASLLVKNGQAMLDSFTKCWFNYTEMVAIK